jgi:predicted nucleotidyltransferase
LSRKNAIKTSDLRGKVAREAAMLLFSGVEKEYKQAKFKAASVFGVRMLPSNLEIGLELNKIIEEIGGCSTHEKLVQMRSEALRIMKLLPAFCPLLIGSTWRGMVRVGSDIDIEVFGDSPEEIVSILKKKDLKLLLSKRTAVPEILEGEQSTHIYFKTWLGYEAEIVVRNAANHTQKRKCDIFGDEIEGLNTKELEKLLAQNPSQKFLPKL